MVRRVVRIVAVVVVVLVLVTAGLGWYLSDALIASLKVPIPANPYDVGVVSVAAGRIVLRVPDTPDVRLDADATTGLEWRGGHAEVGPATSAAHGEQTRTFRLLAGRMPTVGKGTARFDEKVFADPAEAGLKVEDVSYPAPLGRLDGWLLPGTSSTWIVAVHGRGVGREEEVRLLDAVRGLGHPVLVTTYRTDKGEPKTRDMLVTAGQDEVPDVGAAVAFARSRGAKHVLLYGASMGGALALGYAMAHPAGVDGLILEAPLSDLRETASIRVGEALPLPRPLVAAPLALGEKLFEWRTGVSLDRVDYQQRAGELKAPVLLFHGTDDTVVPYRLALQLKAARPGLVELHPVVGASHVRAWNEDRTAYAATIARFVARVSPAG